MSLRGGSKMTLAAILACASVAAWSGGAPAAADERQRQAIVADWIEIYGAAPTDQQVHEVQTDQRRWPGSELPDEVP